MKSYYCGPAPLQFIVGSDPCDSNGFASQAGWAADLNTEAQGATWIGDLVYQINAKTSWDDRAGNYVTKDISGWGKKRYRNAVTSQVGYHSSPYGEHPWPHSDWYPCLSTSGGYGGWMDEADMG